MKTRRKREGRVKNGGRSRGRVESGEEGQGWERPVL